MRGRWSRENVFEIEGEREREGVNDLEGLSQGDQIWRNFVTFAKK